MSIGKVQKRAMQEIYHYVIEGLEKPVDAWTRPDMILQIAELFVDPTDKVWVRNLKMEPVSADLIHLPGKAFLELCRLCYPQEDFELRGNLIRCRNVSGQFLSADEKAAAVDLIGLEGFIYLAGGKRAQLEDMGMPEEAIEEDLAYWEKRLA
ncbi:MAG: hypothetical protein AAF902_03015 [Chloroflexota bacterium]